MLSSYAIYCIHLGKIIATTRDSSDFATNRTKYMGPTVAQEPVGTVRTLKVKKFQFITLF